MTLARSRALDDARLRETYRFAELVRPHVGLIERVPFLSIEPGEVDLEIAATSLGNLTLTFPHVSNADGTDMRDEAIGGGGADVDPELSWVRAVVEGAERYSSMAHTASDFVVATADELGAAAVDLAGIPRCSDAEHADPSCPLRPARSDVPIRWVRGVSLADMEDRHVPAVMAHLYLKPWPSEQFWLPISTGVAAHTCLSAAVDAAICEGIERDAMALAWLLRLELPRIKPPRGVSSPLANLLGRLARSRVEHVAFDATTDLGVPTVFAVQVTEGHPSCELFVSCATDMDPEVAYAKAIREASPGRAILGGAPPCPASVEDFTELTDGATYYGRGGHREDFDFLLAGDATTTLDTMRERAAPATAGWDRTKLLLARLREHEMDAIAVDLTADEVRDAGLWVVRVVIPQLVPISFVHRARYLGTARLLDQARLRGRDGAGFNPSPLPFA
jgi:ribosomal protein S12 methylthiotransferase accessory factor